MDNALMNAVTSGLTIVIGWVGNVLNALTQTDGDLSGLLPLLAIGISISALMFGIKAIRSVIWGA